MIKITKEFIEVIAKKAETVPRRRLNHNFHEDMSDPINRMINAVGPDAYFPPHKHEAPDKREIFIILTGRVLVVEFHGDGRIKDHMILDAAKGDPAVEIPAKEWHSLVPLEPSTLYEIKDGPYSSVTDKVFAEWAPAEEDEARAKEFVGKILRELGVLDKINFGP